MGTLGHIWDRRSLAPSNICPYSFFSLSGNDSPAWLSESHPDLGANDEERSFVDDDIDVNNDINVSDGPDEAEASESEEHDDDNDSAGEPKILSTFP